MEQAGSFDDQVRDQAYKLWEFGGRPDGRTDEFWLQAQAIVSDRETARSHRAHERWVNAGRPLWQSDRFWFEAAEASQAVPLDRAIPTDADAVIIFDRLENISPNAYFQAFTWGLAWGILMMPFSQMLFGASTNGWNDQTRRVSSDLLG